MVIWAAQHFLCHPPDDKRLLAILEPADVGFIGDTIAVPETSSGQATPLIATISPLSSPFMIVVMLFVRRHGQAQGWACQPASSSEAIG
jgi:hypothetical protein